MSGYFRFESSELNLFEPPGAQDGAVVSYGIPSQASNVVSNLNVPIDASLEFGSDFKGSVLGVGGRGEMSVDLTESGTITIHRTSSNAAGPSTPATITLVSDLFKQYGTVNSSPVQFGEYPEFPAGSVTASLNSNDGTLTISMDNTQWLADAGGLWQLLLVRVTALCQQSRGDECAHVFCSIVIHSKNYTLEPGHATALVTQITDSVCVRLCTACMSTQFC